MGEADAGRLPGRARLDHHPAQARGLPRRPSPASIPSRSPRFGERDVARLLADAGIIRSRAKIEATIGGARIYCEMATAARTSPTSAGPSPTASRCTATAETFPTKTPLSETISKELKRRGFKFVGPTIVYAWMQAVGIVNDHSAGCFRRQQVSKATSAR